MKEPFQRCSCGFQERSKGFSKGSMSVPKTSEAFQGFSRCFRGFQRRCRNFGMFQGLQEFPGHFRGIAGDISGVPEVSVAFRRGLRVLHEFQGISEAFKGFQVHSKKFE